MLNLPGLLFQGLLNVIFRIGLSQNDQRVVLIVFEARWHVSEIEGDPRSLQRLQSERGRFVPSWAPLILILSQASFFRRSVGVNATSLEAVVSVIHRV